MPIMSIDAHETVKLATGDALMVKRVSGATNAQVSRMSGAAYAGAPTSGATALQVGPFGSPIELVIAGGLGSVYRYEVSVAAHSVAV